MLCVGLGTARHAAQAMQIGDFWIPADTRVMVSMLRGFALLQLRACVICSRLRRWVEAAV